MVAIRSAARGLVLAAAVLVLDHPPARGAGKKVVLIAGPDHEGISHQHLAGVELLARLLDRGPLSPVVFDTWPARADALAGAATVVLYLDGGDQHPLLAPERRAAFDQHAAAGGGIVALHGAVRFPKRAAAEALGWLGGYVDGAPGKDVRASWPAPFPKIGQHPVGRGLAPFTLEDRWPPVVELPPGSTVTVVLSAVPPQYAASRARPGAVPAAWAFERAGGGRSFALTGGRYLENWSEANLRRLVVNAVLWTAKLEVPAAGAPVAAARPARPSR